MSADAHQEMLDKAHDALRQAMRIFLHPDYDDSKQGWEVEDYMKAVEHYLQEWAAQEGLRWGKP
jgi:hypothetical protein